MRVKVARPGDVKQLVEAFSKALRDTLICDLLATEEKQIFNIIALANLADAERSGKRKTFSATQAVKAKARKLQGQAPSMRVVPNKKRKAKTLWEARWEGDDYLGYDAYDWD